MKLSTKGRYGLRALIDLAQYSENEPVSITNISDRQGISERYLEQLMSMLKKAGLVKSIRGAGGGYLLTRTPEEYTVGEILRQLEGNLAPVSCVSGGGCCGRADRCVTLEVWQQIQDAVDGVVDNITLADLVARQREKCGTAE